LSEFCLADEKGADKDASNQNFSSRMAENHNKKLWKDLRKAALKEKVYKGTNSEL